MKTTLFIDTKNSIYIASNAEGGFFMWFNNGTHSKIKNYVYQTALHSIFISNSGDIYITIHFNEQCTPLRIE